MPPKPAPGDALEWATGIPTCTLDEAGIRDQRDRYARLASTVAHVEREPDQLLIEFDENCDHRTLGEAIAVERECCPFLQFDFDELQRRLRVTVAEAEQRLALDAIAHALQGAHPVTTQE